MIDTANKYILTEVVPSRITGKILPAVDGTDERHVLRHENVSYLTEMCREVKMLAEPSYLYPQFIASDVVPGYRKDAYVLDAATLNEIVSVARDEFSLVGGRSNQDTGVIPPEWADSTSYPIGGIGVNDPMDQIKDTMELVRASRSVARLPVGDDVRRMYYDLSRMNRFYGPLGRAPSGSNLRWQQIVDTWNIGAKSDYLMLGPFVEGDGNMTYYEKVRTSATTTPYVGYSRPYMGQAYENGDPWYTSRLDGPLCTVSAKPLVGYHWERTILVWITFSFEAIDTSDVRTTGTVAFKSPMSYMGSTSGTVMSDIGEYLQSVDMLGAAGDIGLFFQRAKMWAQAYVTGFGGHEKSFSIMLENIYHDTGPIELRSEIGSTGWDWQPPQENQGEQT